MAPKLSYQEKNKLLALSHFSLNCLYDEKPEDCLTKYTSSSGWLTPILLESHPCFVTLTTGHGRLRGCIGSMVAHEALYKNVFRYTRAAALEDPRFPPVKHKEISGLKVGISVLGQLVAVHTFSEITVGEHGLLIRGDGKQGVLLADVATQRKWDVLTFLNETCIKAGLNPKKLSEYEVLKFPQVSF